MTEPAFSIADKALKRFSESSVTRTDREDSRMVVVALWKLGEERTAKFLPVQDAELGRSAFSHSFAVAATMDVGCLSAFSSAAPRDAFYLGTTRPDKGDALPDDDFGLVTAPTIPLSRTQHPFGQEQV